MVFILLIKRKAFLKVLLLHCNVYITLIPTQGIPFMVNHFQKKIDNIFGIKYDKDKVDIIGYLSGFIFIIAIYLLETFIIKSYICYMERK